MKTSKLYQYSTYGSLAGGHYAGTGRLSDIVRDGCDGLGTLDGADGETIIVDGTVYHGRDDGSVHVAPPDALTPYTAVFRHGETAQLTGLSRLTEPPRADRAYTIRADGHFTTLTVGNKPKQTAPYTRAYSDIVATQPQFTATDVTGTLVGIWSPKELESLAGQGFHLHFISTGRTFGGHVVSYTASTDTIFSLGQVSEIRQIFAD